LTAESIAGKQRSATLHGVVRAAIEGEIACAIYKTGVPSWTGFREAQLAAVLENVLDKVP
jgi:hypothetical protein